MVSMNGRGPRNRSVFILTIVSPIILGTLLLSGCKAGPTWSTESRSPDGSMIATAEAFANGGFAAPGPTTTFVYLRATRGSQKPVLIFAFSEGPPDSMEVKISWLTPRHLDVTYEGEHTVDFQAVKYDGVDISIRNAALGSTGLRLGS